jgi:GDP-L-fucose synthase
MKSAVNLSEKRILITGGSGLVGQHLRAELESRGAREFFCPRSSEFDMREPNAVDAVFREVRPQLVFSLAARVGGILENKNFPADFYFDNIRIGAYTFDASAKYKVEKLVNMGAGCGYPLKLQEPLREGEFWDGYPQPESAAYSLAKKMLVVQGIAYGQQYGLKAITLIPSNLYGGYDNFNLDQAHVIPALVRKFYEATRQGGNQVEVWGNGSAKRDFIHASDVATALVDASLSYDGTLPLNIAYGRQHSIHEVVELLTEISGFNGRVFWNTTKPSGQTSRQFSLENLHRHLPNFHPRINLKEGLSFTYDWLAKNYESARL